MSTIPSLTTFTASTRAKAAEVNANFSSIRTTVNTYGAFVDGSARVQRQAYAGQRGAYAGVFRDLPGIVLGHVQVGSNENALTLYTALGAQIGKAKEVHGGGAEGKSAR